MLLKLLKMPTFALELPLISPTQALLVWLMGPNVQFKEIWLNMGLGRILQSRKNTLTKSSIKKRVIWGFKRLRWTEKDFYGYRFSNESHFAYGLQQRA
jgi:hypothetical protein